ncbi:MAG TPA: aminotransferase class V-fold PLP-dependent enzyme [Pyrinomonadaceae bacterium]|nr:aminotransferase class V-fold PLP-dependent enzyme [Pyrinomonadaceae bacterium]
MAELSSKVTKLVTNYLAQVSGYPVFPPTSAGKTFASLDKDFALDGEPLEALLSDLQVILDNSRHNGHPRFFGYVASPANPVGVFADLVASALNSNVTSWRSGPAATEIERAVVRWLGSLVGFRDNASGLLTSGGSIANFTALFVAHRAKSGGSSQSGAEAYGAVGRKGLWDSRAPMTIYASEETHLSIPKAADLMGIGRDQVRLVPCDDRLRIDVAKLRETIAADLKRGLKPFCVVGSAGTVNTGAVDPLNEIAKVAKEFDLWFHVDGAYGAPGALDESKRQLFAGIDQADSLSLDPHKWLYVPLDAGCILFKDEAKHRAAFTAEEADYIKVHERDDEAFAFWDYGPELSRRFRALKIWFTLRYYGVARIAAAIAEDNSLAQYLAQLVESSDDFELLAPVELSICCFRYMPASLRGDEVALNELNTRIMHTVQRGGEAYVSNATIGGKFALRACITNFRTTRADIDKTLEIIRAAAT